MVVATLAKPETYPQLAELLQQLFETGTAAPELIDAITGSDPPPTDVDNLYLGNREEAYDAIQCSDSTCPPTSPRTAEQHRRPTRRHRTSAASLSST